MALDWTVPREPDARGRRAPQPAVHVLHRRGQRRRVEDHGCGTHVDADLRRSAHRIDRDGRRRAVGRQHRVRRQRGRAAPAGSLDRRRRLQVDRCRARPGRTSAFATRSRSRRSRSIRATRIASSSRPSGHPYGPNDERGIYRSTDGGRSFQKVLSKDENTGGNDVDIDPANPEVVYATLWEERQGPWENAVWAGTERRHLQVHRRRHDLESTDEGLAQGRPGERRDLTSKPEAPLRDRRRVR